MPRVAKKAHLWPREPNNWYIEPEWCSERLFAQEPFAGDLWDPFAGSGRIVIAARAAGLNAFGTDLFDRQLPEPIAGRVDFMGDQLKMVKTTDNIVSNPPYVSKTSQVLVDRCLQLARDKVALLLPFRWLVPWERSFWIEKTPLRRVLCLTPRPSLPPGQVVLRRPDEYLVPEEDLYDASPANGNVDFAWYVWEHGHCGAVEVGWCRRTDGTGSNEDPGGES